MDGFLCEVKTHAVTASINVQITTVFVRVYFFFRVNKYHERYFKTVIRNFTSR